MLRLLRNARAARYGLKKTSAKMVKINIANTLLKLINIQPPPISPLWTSYPLQGFKVMPPTKFSDFMKEIEDEAMQEGPGAVFELESLRAHFKKERCLVEEFFAHQQKLPSNRRTNHCMISCPCSKCSPSRL